jgi:hypothetical protein
MEMLETYRLLVCRCCLLTHANGECCAEEHSERNLPEPWALLPENDTVTAGMGRTEHNEDCPFSQGGSEMPDDCDCENYGYSTQPCQGCGDTHHGDRFWMTAWVGDRAKN